MKSDDEPRWALIAHIKEQIEANTYVTKGKLIIASERLIKDLHVAPQSERCDR